MPRLKVSYKIKRKFHGNRYRPSSVSGLDENVHINRPKLQPKPQEGSSILSNRSSLGLSSSSSKKLNLSEYNDYQCSGDGNCIFNLDLLSSAIKSFVGCKFCGRDNCIELKMLDTGKYKHGLSVNIELKCSHCDNSSLFNNSIVTATGKYDINMKFICALRAIGKGHAAGNVFCSLLELPSPVANKSYISYNKELHSALEKCAQDSMKRATNEAISENTADVKTDLAVAIDGTWQKRGFTSMNGVISVTSVDTGKVLDVAIMSKYCQSCAIGLSQETETHECTKNYEGSSGGMEAAGALEIFRNSVLREVRYVKYLGDGDSKGFQKVVESNPYGDSVKVEKLECIGHIQKRMGRRLRNLKKSMSGQKLYDGKVIGGRNRLTNTVIDKLQKYYGLAIRRGVGSLDDMKRNIWATYFHKLSTDESPQHGLCPTGPDTWCTYNKAKFLKQPHKHKDNIPKTVMLAIKQIYTDLSQPELLKKCLHGRTQNQNESFNNIIWSKIPKNTFIRLRTLKIGVYEAVLSFNEGHLGKLALYKELGLKLCKRSVDSLRKFDNKRVTSANKAAEEMTKEAKQTRRAMKRLQEDEEILDDLEYRAGLF